MVCTPHNLWRPRHGNFWSHSRGATHSVWLVRERYATGSDHEHLLNLTSQRITEEENASRSATRSYQRAEGCPAQSATGVYSMKPDRQEKGWLNVQKALLTVLPYFIIRQKLWNTVTSATCTFCCPASSRKRISCFSHYPPPYTPTKPEFSISIASQDF